MTAGTRATPLAGQLPLRHAQAQTAHAAAPLPFSAQAATRSSPAPLLCLSSRCCAPHQWRSTRCQGMACHQTRVCSPTPAAARKPSTCVSKCNCLQATAAHTPWHSARNPRLQSAGRLLCRPPVHHRGLLLLAGKTFTNNPPPQQPAQKPSSALNLPDKPWTPPPGVCPPAPPPRRCPAPS